MISRLAGIEDFDTEVTENTDPHGDSLLLTTELLFRRLKRKTSVKLRVLRDLRVKVFNSRQARPQSPQ